MPSEPSIHRRLLIGVISTIVLIWTLMVVLVYRSSSHEIDEIYDASLASYARVLVTLMLHEAEEEQAFEQQFRQLVTELGMKTVQRSQVLSRLMNKMNSSDAREDYLSLYGAESTAGHHYESKIAFLIKTPNGRVLLRSTTSVPLEKVGEGYETHQFGEEQWRTFKLSDPEQAVIVSVGEHTAARMELHREILINGLWPFVIMLPIVILAAWGAIQKGLKPLQSVTARVASRSPTSLTPLSKHGTPVEILPLIDALNDLFNRVESALDNERRFTANAAHELRTPLAAIKTHAQVLQLNAPPDMLPAINHVIHGIDRASHMVQQLLTLARAEIRSQEESQFSSLDLVKLTRKVMLDFSSQALEKNIDLSLETVDEPLLIEAEEALLQIVVQNLLDNAIRYTPESGTIRVVIEAGKETIRLYIEDSGPGIDPDKQELMFQRFQRGEAEDQLGVGLGLSIVSQIVQLHKIDLSLDKSAALGGLKVTLTLCRQTLNF